MSASSRKRAARAVSRTKVSSRGRGWRALGQRELMGVRLKDLGLAVGGTPLEERLEQLDGEFERAGLRFRPYAWLSTDWFTPDGTTGFAVPFYLADKKLAQLERREMLEVEGGTREWCMKLLRHEAAHAIDNAYHLRRRKTWREVFGPVSLPYRASYRPDPGSRRYVVNLDYWYAQSHPIEDFAETFAVWLRPGSRWRQRYAGWPALEKLEYVDALMTEISDRPPRLRTKLKVEPVSQLSRTLGDYYRTKQRIYQSELPSDVDATLLRLFSDEPRHARRDSAAVFLQKNRASLRERIAHLTGQQAYVVDQVVNELILRCRKLRLRLADSKSSTLVDAGIVLATLTMNFVYGGHPDYHR